MKTIQIPDSPFSIGDYVGINPYQDKSDTFIFGIIKDADFTIKSNIKEYNPTICDWVFDVMHLSCDTKLMYRWKFLEKDLFKIDLNNPVNKDCIKVWDVIEDARLMDGKFVKLRKDNRWADYGIITQDESGFNHYRCLIPIKEGGCIKEVLFKEELGIALEFVDKSLLSEFELKEIDKALKCHFYVDPFDYEQSYME